MKELALKYGCNPNQKPARIYCEEGELPIEILNGNPGYINLLDAFNSWQLVMELKEATGLPAASSFKHVSPAGAAVAVPLDATTRRIYFTEDMEISSPIAAAYVRARGADRLSSFGDFIALSDECDEQLAAYLAKEVSDGIIAPSYSDKALEILKKKKGGAYVVIRMDPDYCPEKLEKKQVFGVTFEQGRNDCRLTEELFRNIVTERKDLSPAAIRDMQIAMITLKYTQSNSVCFVKDGQAIGVGAGQQSRVHCTRLAANKADNWYLRQHEKVMNLPFREDIRRPERDNAVDAYIGEESEELLAEGKWREVFREKPETLTKEEKKAWLAGLKGVALGSDAFFPFGDSIERAAKSGVEYAAQPGGAKRQQLVVDTCDRLGIAMAILDGVRLFHH